MTRGRGVWREGNGHEGSPFKIDTPREGVGLCAEPDENFNVIASRGACAEAWQSPRSDRVNNVGDCDPSLAVTSECPELNLLAQRRRALRTLKLNPLGLSSSAHWA